ncbi:hypothetical protein CRENBAI_025310 [Crenichthys baileyi]|uniref:Ig-like domain-containing protein n=1 Tax=Crenichthys baileyi TaxID=28760 RepID=A0AAV9SG46_9TELE
MQVVPWRGAALLLCCACLCAGVEKDCVLGKVGEPVLLPCLYPALSTFLNFSIEWRKYDKVVFRSLWDEDGNVETWSVNHVRIPTDAPLTGNFSLELPSAHPKHDRSQYSLFLLSGENQSAPLCTMCLRIAASFRTPEVKKEHTEENDESTYLCHSSGGYPEPVVYWLINNSQEPPNGSVRTQAEALPDSHLYNITSQLTVNIPKDATVSCTIKNPSMNEKLTSKYGASPNPVEWQASHGMWIFSTVLCVVVAIMVLAGVYYQIHLDRINKRRKKEYEEPQRGRRYQWKQAAEAMMPEQVETDV